MATYEEVKKQQDALRNEAEKYKGYGGNNLMSKALNAQAEALNSQLQSLNLQNKSQSATQNIQNLIGQMQAPANAPKLDPYNERRLKALEEEAQAVSLSQDPLFQGQRAQLVQGGQQALSSVQNKQRALGVSGGFSNVGSVADIYDRLSGQLAGLGESATRSREAKRDIVAQERQGLLDRQSQYADAQIDFENKRKEALMAAERGDYEMAMQMYQLAEQSRQQMAALEAQNSAASKQLWGSILGGAMTAGGAILGGPVGAGIGAGLGSALGGAMSSGETSGTSSYIPQGSMFSSTGSAPKLGQTWANSKKY